MYNIVSMVRPSPELAGVARDHFPMPATTDVYIPTMRHELDVLGFHGTVRACTCELGST